MKFVNCTPHELTIRNAEGVVETLPRSEHVARVEVTHGEKVSSSLVVPLYRSVRGGTSLARASLAPSQRHGFC